jgi:hypothetical protein
LVVWRLSVLIDEPQRREAAAQAEAEELRGRIAELAERLARVEGCSSSCIALMRSV